MKKFNIPYNFDPKLLAGLNILGIKQSNISCIYLPPDEIDYITIKKNDTIPSGKDYLEHLNMINNQFPNKAQLLLQQTNNLIDNVILKKYIDLNITKFCVGSLQQAKEIKDILPEAEITGSITMHINKEQLEENKQEYLKYFDYFVLDFTYNRDIDKIYNLPKDFKYILIVNTTCYSNCPSDFHWFTNDYQNFNCPYTDKKTWTKTSIINPLDLPLFDPYISSYKIVERGFPTRAILTNILLYNDFIGYFPDRPPNELLYKKTLEE